MDLQSVNVRKEVVVVVNCKVPADTKGDFIKLAGSQGLNTNQLLATIVDKAVRQWRENGLTDVDFANDYRVISDLRQQLDGIRKERDMHEANAAGLQKELLEARKLSDQVKTLLEEKKSLQEKLKKQEQDNNAGILKTKASIDKMIAEDGAMKKEMQGKISDLLEKVKSLNATIQNLSSDKLKLEERIKNANEYINKNLIFAEKKQF